MKLALVMILLSGCTSVPVPPSKVVRDTVRIPQQYVMVRSCTTGITYSADSIYQEPPYWKDEYTMVQQTNINGFIITEVRDTIVFEDGRWFYPSPMCDCWGCLDSLKIEKIN